MEKKTDTIKFRIEMQKKEKWKQICLQKNISLTNLIVKSVENRLLENERKLVLEFIEKQGKIQNNINQFAKIANSKNDVSSNDLRRFNQMLQEIETLKKVQIDIFNKIYSKL